MINRTIFYSGVKVSLFGGKLRQIQVDGMEALLNECDLQKVTDPRHIAYLMATVYHETDRTMAPIEEYDHWKNRVYGHRVWRNGKHYADLPHVFYGRGLVQTTWRDNYRKLSLAARQLGRDWDFEKNPELLLDLLPSAWAAVYGMRTGLYTSRKLEQYFNGTVDDPIMARRIINGTKKGEKLPDKAELIKSYYTNFLGAVA